MTHQGKFDLFGLHENEKLLSRTLLENEDKQDINRKYFPNAFLVKELYPKYTKQTNKKTPGKQQ